ncbi:MAG: response regulator [Deltaproteobacteria bacterium]|nr:response regulator [Deltaproteobacteria bacterium]
MRVLIVDDDPAVRLTLAMAFENTGWQLATAGSGQEALAKLESATFDVLILDKNLPDTTGVDLLRRQRLSGNRAHAFIITGQADARSAADTLELGIDGYYEKPFDNVYEVVKAIRETVQRNRRGNPADLAQASTHFRRSQSMLGDGRPVSGHQIERGLALCPDQAEAELVDRALRELCVEVDSATSSQQAIDHMRARRPELVVLDAQQIEPKVTWLAEQYRSLVPHGVVLVLGRQQLGLDSLKKLIGLGVDGLIDRPLDAAQLRAKLMQALQQAAWRRGISDVNG